MCQVLKFKRHYWEGGRKRRRIGGGGNEEGREELIEKQDIDIVYVCARERQRYCVYVCAREKNEGSE